jgi:hypothetical protein
VNADQAFVTVREALEQRLGAAGSVFSPQQTHPEPIVFRAPGKPALAFLFYDLTQSEPEHLKKVLHDAHAGDLAAFESVRANRVKPLGVMPCWLGAAQQDFSSDSPATLPRPVRRGSTGPWRYRYTVKDRGLDFRGQVARKRGIEPVPVLILDAMPDWSRARRQAKRFAPVNAQLPELLDFLGDVSLPDWHTQALESLDTAGVKVAPRRNSRGQGLDATDHALFIAGLIHDLAPANPISLRPVLNRDGVGDLYLLLRVLQEVVASKPPEQPLIITMALGFMPQREYLPYVWYGVQRPNDADFVGDVQIAGEARDQAWITSNPAEMKRTMGLLQGGLDELGGYLLANNCLGVAAVGNDSLRRVEAGRPRFGPRYPASDEAVMGVAATTVDPDLAADYSNMGEELEAGDHIATFGGGMRPAADTPRDGVFGVFTTLRYPRGPRDKAGPLRNDNGWAEWSGTSFATAIASGLVAGFWTLGRAERPQVCATDVLAEFHARARHYASAVRTPSVAMRGAWERA